MEYEMSHRQQDYLKQAADHKQGHVTIYNVQESEPLVKFGYLAPRTGGNIYFEITNRGIELLGLDVVKVRARISANLGKSSTIGKRGSIKFGDKSYSYWWTTNHAVGYTGNVLHLFGEMDIPMNGGFEMAWLAANNAAECCGYSAHPIGEFGKEHGVWVGGEGVAFEVRFFNNYINTVKDVTLERELQVAKDEVAYYQREQKRALESGNQERVTHLVHTILHFESKVKHFTEQIEMRDSTADELREKLQKAREENAELRGHLDTDYRRFLDATSLLEGMHNRLRQTAAFRDMEIGKSIAEDVLPQVIADAESLPKVVAQFEQADERARTLANILNEQSAQIVKSHHWNDAKAGASLIDEVLSRIIADANAFHELQVSPDARAEMYLNATLAELRAISEQLPAELRLPGSPKLTDEMRKLLDAYLNLKERQQFCDELLDSAHQQIAGTWPGQNSKSVKSLINDVLPRLINDYNLMRQLVEELGRNLPSAETQDERRNKQDAWKACLAGQRVKRILGIINS